jgi:integrase
MPRMLLTDRFVAGAKATGSQRLDFFDEKTRGLALRVSPGGNKAWTFHFTSPKDERRARVTLGSYPGTTLAAARTRATEARTLLEDGRDPRDVFAEQNSGAMTVRGLVASYLEKHVRPKLRTAKAVERRFEKNIIPVIGDVKVADLHRRDVNRAVDPILARGRPIEASRCFEDVRALVRWGVGRGDLDHNPIDGMKKPATSTPRERVLSDDEIRALWNGLPDVLARSKAAQRIVRLCLATAQRIGEVAGMRCDELDLRAATWSLPGRRTKNGHPHQIPLTALATSIIDEALRDAGEDSVFVFPNTKGDEPLPAHAIAKTLTRAQRPTEQHPNGRFGIGQFTAHDLRRTAVTGMARLGVAPIVLGHVINHRSTTKAGVTLAVYAHYDHAAEKRQALELWAGRLAAIVDGGVATVVAIADARRAGA